MGARTVPHLLRLLEGKPEEARAAAVELGRRRERTAVDALAVALCEHADPGVREAAAEALAAIGTPDALLALRAAAESDGQGRDAAAKALGELK
ncbi:MAG: HEAT repeat domain-containing protein [Armatimonadetes bacterium]|nr:HEAT repeat domain-containing protein [Armatimonadota bacterium]